MNPENINNKVMKRNFIILILLLLAYCTFGQIKKTTEIPVNKNGDTTLVFKWIHDLPAQLKIDNLVYSDEQFHFRFWQDGQALDIWTVDNKNFQGQVTNYVWEYRSSICKKKKPKPGKLYTNQYILDAGQAKTAYNLIFRDSILTIPSEGKITGWSQGCDGITYSFELSTPDTYTFKSYWTPTAQDSLKEAKKILDFVKGINTIANLPQYKTRFFGTLPGGRYSDGSRQVMLIPEKVEPDFYYDYDYDYDYDDYYLDY